MSLPEIPPSRFDPGWISSHSFETIMAFGSDLNEVRWIRELYAWLYIRQQIEARKDLLPPDPSVSPRSPFENGLIPVLLKSSSASPKVGLMKLTYMDEKLAAQFEFDGELLAAVKASRAARKICNQQDLSGLLSVDNFSPVPERRYIADGGSDGLMAFIAVLVHSRKASLPEDVCATGSWEGTDNPEDGKLVPINGFAQKLQVARQWGFRRIFYIEGQEDLPIDVGSPDGITLISVPADPYQASQKILKTIFPTKFRLAWNFRRLTNVLILLLMAMLLMSIERWAKVLGEHFDSFRGTALGLLLMITAVFGYLKQQPSTGKDRLWKASVLFILGLVIIVFTLVPSWRPADSLADSLLGWLMVFGIGTVGFHEIWKRFTG